MKHWKWIASTGLVAVLAIANGMAKAPKEADDDVNVKVGGKQMVPVFRQFDIDGNGEITRAELRQADKAFDSLDRNNDGVVSSEDFPRLKRQARMRRAHHRGVIVKSLAKAADVDSSGSVTKAEWTNVVGTLKTDADGAIDRESLHATLGIEPRGPRGGQEGRGKRGAQAPDADDADRLGPRGHRMPPKPEDLIELFDRLDRDQSGVLEAKEMTRRHPRGAEGRDGRRGADKQGNAELRRDRGMRKGPMSQADADQSGTVSADEWKAMFSTLDLDGDGILSKEELAQGRRGPRMHRQR